METVEASPGVDLVEDELPGCSNCFGDGYIEDEFGFIKFCQCETEPRLSHQRTQRAIAPATKNHLEEESDQNLILTGLTFSASFLARYSPPQSESIHYKVITDGSKVGSDGQLSLLDVQVVTEPEPPDPDDVESLDAFREAIARWDLEHPSSFDHFSDRLSSSVHSEPPDPDDFDSMFAFWAAYDAWDEASDDDSEPLEISLDSFCEWAPCPPDWYEPVALDGSSKVLEMSSARKSSITSDFFIPTFGSLGDRSNRSDEPPDTGIFARSPKPKPPTFPPQASQPKSARHPETIPKLSRNYPETIASRRRWQYPASPIASGRWCDAIEHCLREALDNFSSQNQPARSSFFKALRRSLPLPISITQKQNYAFRNLGSRLQKEQVGSSRKKWKNSSF
jgi:hypothetical protein